MPCYLSSCVAVLPICARRPGVERAAGRVRGGLRIARIGPAADNRLVRIATWNVNSLKARMDRVLEWLERGQPDVLLMQETKLADDDAPLLPFQMRGYELVHHGEGRWNGVAIASRLPIDHKHLVTNFGDGPVRNSAAGADTNFAEEDFNPFDEARMLSATIGGIRFVCLYAPNGRVVDSPFYTGKLAWYERLRSWLADRPRPTRHSCWAAT